MNQEVEVARQISAANGLTVEKVKLSFINRLFPQLANDREILLICQLSPEATTKKISPKEENEEGNTEILEVTGSPLEHSFGDDSFNVSAASLKRNWMNYEERYIPISLKMAVEMINCTREELCKNDLWMTPLFVIADPEKNDEQCILVGCYPDPRGFMPCKAYLGGAMSLSEIQEAIQMEVPLVQHNTNARNLLGHSLGAHIMGYVGKNIPGIQRITALDPAQPGFEGKNPLIRLNGSDAQFVDVIHTDGRPFLPLLGLGYTSGVGNVDFFVNGGKFQPNCALDGENFPYKRIAEIPKITIAILYNLATCSHTRAPRYMAAAIKESCNMWGYRYNATQATFRYENFIIDDECSVDNCTPMGLTTHNYPALGNFAMETTGTYPFCKTDRQADRKMARAILK